MVVTKGETLQDVDDRTALWWGEHQQITIPLKGKKKQIITADSVGQRVSRSDHLWPVGREILPDLTYDVVQRILEKTQVHTGDKVVYAAICMEISQATHFSNV